ncbi:peptidylprolyl isomerase [Gemmobacter fulvus]|uniref:Parvulin-like PPIase n=1 Tax=Gemmobacter fulvus TaxID=2840474 RepID=A0A975P5T6_9RHOB|nr:peptidylprolyl isomerase [Gemmobacter fulvus]MBT9245293.1 peptidylprolyl isomerase [Gemmobacter fulvus]QWK90384.1 peptidylprolyl isomerase [Gemmobacter fulvus]
MTRFLPLLTASLIALAAAGGPGAAQENLFAPRIIINDRAVTHYEYQQRLLFMRLLRAPGDLEKEALDGLIEDRLRLQEAKRLGIKPAEEDLRKGMEEFAARANLSADDFIKALGQGGVAAETFRDFVSAGLVWREIVRAKFGPLTKVTDLEVDRAIAAETRKMALNVAVSELIIPAPPGQEAAAMALAQQIKADVRSEAGFTAAVARHSAAQSREQGGRLPMMPLANLPQGLGAVILGLAPGKVSDPVTLPGAVALFQLRGLEEVRTSAPAAIQVEYARLRLPATPEADAQLAQIRSRSDTCKDLYGTAPNLPEDQLIVETKPMSAIAQDIGLALSRMDAGESVLRNVGGARELLMLCARMPVSEEPINRAAVRDRLLNQKVEAQSDLYLATLRANAIIREP